MNNTCFLSALLSLSLVSSFGLADNTSTESNNHVYFDWLTEEQKSMYEYIAYRLPSKYIRNKIMWEGKNHGSRESEIGSIFRGVCEQNHERSDELACKTIIKAFENINYERYWPTEKGNQERTHAFNTCTRVKENLRSSHAWIEEVDRWEYCHELSGRFGPSDYYAWKVLNEKC